MSANRRRHINALPGLKLLMFLSVGAILLMTGLGYVYCQNELHRMLTEVGKLEKDFQQLRTMSEVAQVNIAKLSAQPELEKKRANGFFKLAVIDDTAVVRIPASPKNPGADVKQLRPVSNGKGKP